jgi:hypothetical protein
VKLLLDEMWSPDLAIQLRRHGHDVVAVAERPDLRGQPDPAVFATAVAEARAVVTENVADYRPLAEERVRQGATHPGLILTSNRRFPRHDRRTAGRLVVALDALLSAEPDLTNQEHWLS